MQVYRYQLQLRGGRLWQQGAAGLNYQENLNLSEAWWSDLSRASIIKCHFNDICLLCIWQLLYYLQRSLLLLHHRPHSLGAHPILTFLPTGVIHTAVSWLDFLCLVLYMLWLYIVLYMFWLYTVLYMLWLFIVLYMLWLVAILMPSVCQSCCPGRFVSPTAWHDM